MSEPIEDHSETVLAPSDMQIEHSPLVYLSVWINPSDYPERVWVPFANTPANPLPGAFRDALIEAVEEVAGVQLPDDTVNVLQQQRPPFADPLFPIYFVDLTRVIEFLQNTVPEIIISTIISKSLELLPRKAGAKLPGGGAGDHLKDRYTGETLEVLCKHFVRVHRPSVRVQKTARRAFNRRFEGGYVIPTDPSIPTGWTITVDTKTEHFEFTVDESANVLRLEITCDGERSVVKSASLKSPELSDMSVSLIAP